MVASSQNLNTIPAADVLLDEPPTVERLETLARLLQEYQDEKSARDADETVALPGDIDALCDELNKLRISSAAPDWDERVKQAWTGIEGQWASRSSLEMLEAALEHLLAPLRQEASALDNLEAELKIGQARLETLLLLADVLDELV